MPFTPILYEFFFLCFTFILPCSSREIPILRFGDKNKLCFFSGRGSLAPRDVAGWWVCHSHAPCDTQADALGVVDELLSEE